MPTPAPVPAPPFPAPAVRASRGDDLVDLQRRLEAWLLIARFVTPRTAA